MRRLALICLLSISLGAWARHLEQPSPEPTTEVIMAGPSEPETVKSEPKFSMEDALLLARLLYAECRGEPREGRLGVAQCALDRLEDGRWGKTLKEVITARRQFAAPGLLSEELLADAIAALTGERAFPDHRILYFRSKVSGGRAWFAPYVKHIGGHAFYGYSYEA